MKIPKVLKIQGHVFKVEESELEKDCGATYVFENRIVINKKMKQSMKESTLLHEIICHCINTSFTGESFLAHGLMDSISEQLYQVLHDNNLLK